LSRYTSPSNPTTPTFTEQAYIRDLYDLNFPNPRFNPGEPEAPSASAVNLLQDLILKIGHLSYQV
jgi:hypothetical protein